MVSIVVSRRSHSCSFSLPLFFVVVILFPTLSSILSMSILRWWYHLLCAPFMTVYLAYTNLPQCSSNVSWADVKRCYPMCNTSCIAVTTSQPVNPTNQPTSLAEYSLNRKYEPPRFTRFFSSSFQFISCC